MNYNTHPHNDVAISLYRKSSMTDLYKFLFYFCNHTQINFFGNILTLYYNT